MVKWKANWYTQHEIIKTDTVTTENDDQEEARKQAFMLYNGKPPSDFVYLEKI